MEELDKVAVSVAVVGPVLSNGITRDVQAGAVPAAQ